MSEADRCPLLEDLFGELKRRLQDRGSGTGGPFVAAFPRTIQVLFRYYVGHTIQVLLPSFRLSCTLLPVLTYLAVPALPAI